MSPEKISIATYKKINACFISFYMLTFNKKNSPGGEYYFLDFNASKIFLLSFSER